MFQFASNRMRLFELVSTCFSFFCCFKLFQIVFGCRLFQIVENRFGLCCYWSGLCLAILVVFYVAFGNLCTLGCFKLFQHVSLVFWLSAIVQVIWKHVEVVLLSLLFNNWFKVVLDYVGLFNLFLVFLPMFHDVLDCSKLFQIVQYLLRFSWVFKAVWNYVKLLHFVFVVWWAVFQVVFGRFGSSCCFMLFR